MLETLLGDWSSTVVGCKRDASRRQHFLPAHLLLQWRWLLLRLIWIQRVAAQVPVGKSISDFRCATKWKTLLLRVFTFHYFIFSLLVNLKTHPRQVSAQLRREFLKNIFTCTCKILSTSRVINFLLLIMSARLVRERDFLLIALGSDARTRAREWISRRHKN